MFGKSKSSDPFLAALGRHAETIVVAATAFVELFDHPERAAVLTQSIKDAEHAADGITHETIARLHKQWITPFDRGDLYALITRLDDVIDTIDAAAQHVELFGIDSVPSAARETASLIHQAALGIQKAVLLLPDLSRPQRVLDLCIEIKRLESDADSIYRVAIAELFKPGKDPLLVMKWRDIYGRLEAAADRCEDVANILEGIVLEYS